MIFDLASLKSPLRGGLMALKSHGCRVTSVHPMFGPDTDLLSSRHVIFVDLGHAEALERARDLFRPTMVEQVIMSLDEHDRLIAYVLGLSHAREHRLLHGAGRAAARPRRACRSCPRPPSIRSSTSPAGSRRKMPTCTSKSRVSTTTARNHSKRWRRRWKRSAPRCSSRERGDFTALMRRGREYLEDRRSLNERRV